LEPKTLVLWAFSVELAEAWEASSPENNPSGFLFKGYLCCFLQVRVTAIPGKLIDIVRNPHTAKVKRIKAMGEALG
jgi:hypothetical protein